jgi:hypothetical protein
MLKVLVETMPTLAGVRPGYEQLAAHAVDRALLRKYLLKIECRAAPERLFQILQTSQGGR